MDEGFSATGDNLMPRLRARLERDPARPPVAPHHRRRRAAALAAVAAIALVVGAMAGASAGGGSHHVAKVAGTGGYLRRIKALAGDGAGSFAVAQRAAENAAITRTLARTPYVRVAGSQHKEIALTFDDGPGPYTPRILSVLKRMHTPATFFEVGVEEKYFHASTAQIVARGYPIGDHTQNHENMGKLSPKQQQSQLLHETVAIGNSGAPFPRMFRPPYGLWDNATLKLLKRYRMLMVLWTVDTDDYELPGASTIVNAAVRGARSGAIILMHDAGGDRSETVAALPKIIRRLRKRGYKLVTIPRLLLDNPAPKQQNVYLLSGSG
jgi:peptidoglycan/xylan/chitin deacetylase (PgdA/CDA1 family)